MRFFNSKCIKCIINKYTDAIPDNADEQTKVKYLKRMLGIIAESDLDISAPEIV